MDLQPGELPIKTLKASVAVQQYTTIYPVTVTIVMGLDKYSNAPVLNTLRYGALRGHFVAITWQLRGNTCK